MARTARPLRHIAAGKNSLFDHCLMALCLSGNAILLTGCGVVPPSGIRCPLRRPANELFHFKAQHSKSGKVGNDSHDHHRHQTHHTPHHCPL